MNDKEYEKAVLDYACKIIESPSSTHPIPEPTTDLFLSAEEVASRIVDGSSLVTNDGIYIQYTFEVIEYWMSRTYDKEEVVRLLKENTAWIEFGSHKNMLSDYCCKHGIEFSQGLR